MEFKDGLSKYNIFVSLHRIQLESSGVPEKFWLTLFKKLENQVLDAGNSFSIFRIDYNEGSKGEKDPNYTVLVTNENGVQCNDAFQIYLIDHAWTYENSKARANLNQIPGLLDRMCNLMNIPLNKSLDEKVENVLKEMWRYNQTYSHRFGNAEHQIPVWYIMDEFGSAIEHSDCPNFRTVPFYCHHDQTTYTLLFPVKNVNFKEKVTRDYLEGPFSKNETTRRALLVPWKPASFLDISFKQTEPNNKYFLSEQINEMFSEEQEQFEHHKTKVFKVYSEYDLINIYLTHYRFELVEMDTSSSADILWLTTHFKDYKNLYERFPEKFINQFPCESVLTIKNLLSAICRRKEVREINQFADNPSWCPTTYDLHTDLVKFVSYFEHREKNGLNNLWICKPWNLARGLDTIITNNLNCILRLPSSGPKIAQKYLYNPVLFHRADVGLVKFDIRYVLLLKSVKPLRVYAYKNFFLRFANKPFDLTNFSDKEKHFTVMNYDEETPLFKMLCDEFIEKFNEQNSGYEWSKIEGDIFRSFKEVFEAATMRPPPCGIAHNVQSRALYAVDLMLSCERTVNGSVIQPKILEINWMPDCKRACEYYPNFFNDVFLLLFKDEHDKDKFHLL